MGARLASAARYGAGLSLLTESGGNLIVADGAQLAFQGNASAANPHIINLSQLGNGDGIRLLNSGQMDLVMNSTAVASLTNAVFRVLSALRTDGIIYHIPSADQSITAVGDAILANAAHVKITGDASYTLTSTPTIAAGTDGQVLMIENVGSFSIVLQDEASLPGSLLQTLNNAAQSIGVGDLAYFLYSTDAAAWIQAKYSMNT